jgi:hypothetical protein
MWEAAQGKHVVIYKALEDISRERKLESEERAELKQYSRLADAFTPLAKGMNSEYANQNAYDCIQVHGGSGFMLEYVCQRIYRDARITSIYEGTTQLQTVAAIRYVTNGFYSQVIQELEEKSEKLIVKNNNSLENGTNSNSSSQRSGAGGTLFTLHSSLKTMASKFNACTAAVKETENQELLDLCARHLYEMAADIIMCHLLLQNAAKAPELFGKSLQVYVNLAEAEVEKHSSLVSRMIAEGTDSYRQA